MELREMTKYFAYGSNMLPEQMDERCPGSVPIGVATLAGWRFVINDRGVASIAKDEASEVIGVVWEITEEHEETLDGFEGVADDWYCKDHVDVTMESGRIVNCLVYIDPNVAPGPPREGYLEKIVGGSEFFNLPVEYVEKLRAWFDSVE